MKFFRNIALVLFGFLFLCSFTFAADPDTFYVEASPSSFSVGEWVDITITAVKTDGSTVKDYAGLVMMDIPGVSSADYVVPESGLYDFKESDQGEKRFSKGLQVSKAGTYKLRISDVLNDNVVGETTIIVGNESAGSGVQNIKLTYPIAGSQESKSSINVMGSSETLKNSPVEIYLNKSLVASDFTDSQGNFNVYISGLRSGQNEIQAKIVDINNLVLGESEVAFVTYRAPVDGIFESIEIVPESSIKQGDKVRINVHTSETVGSAELYVQSGNSHPMDRLSQGEFSTELSMLDAGTFLISLALMSNGETKRYENIASVNVKENLGVFNVKFTTTGVDGTTLIITWESLGNPAKYNVLYGTQRDNLQENKIVSSTGIMVENLQKDTKYYFQIVPMDESSHSAGTPSDIFEHSMSVSYPPCIIKGITVSSEKIGDKYFLVWDKVENALSYNVYRSDWADMSSKSKVGETEDTRFEYYFNKDSQSDQYAYYQIEAICPDGSNVLIDDVEKVKVGPFENMLLILVISLFLYCMYRLYRTIENN